MKGLQGDQTSWGDNDVETLSDSDESEPTKCTTSYKSGAPKPVEGAATAKRLSSNICIVNMGKDSSFRNLVAETISKNMVIQGGGPAFGNEDLSYATRSMPPTTGGRITVLQVCLTFGLLLVAALVFVALVAQENGGFDGIAVAIVTNESSVAALTIVTMCMLPLGCVCIGLSNMARRRHQKQNLLCCLSNASVDVFDTRNGRRDSAVNGYTVPEEDVNELV
jgi:hypothetical protein